MPLAPHHLASWLQAALGPRHGAARRRAAGCDDLIAWGQRYLPAHFARPPSTMHRELAAWLDRTHAERGTKLNVLAPRGAAKSTLATLAFPLRAAVEGREPYVWIVSDTRHQAAAHLENLKAELLENARLAADYPQAAGRGPVWRSGAVRLRNGVAIEAFGTGQRIRGRRRGAFRPTLIVCDDLENDGHALSAAARRRSREWFHAALLKAGTPQTNVVHLATALHHDALALRLARTPGWISCTYRAIVCWPQQMTLWHAWEALYTDLANPRYRQAARAFYEANRAAMDAGAAVLWPEVEDLYTLMTMRAEGGRRAFDREKQNEPLRPDECEWPEEYFSDALWFDDWPPVRLSVLALDPSKGSDSRRGDYSAFVLVGVDEEGLLYVEADLARRPVERIVEDAVELVRRFRPTAVGVEANQFQELLAGQLGTALRAAGLTDVEPWLLHNRQAKAVRIRRLGPLLAAGRLRFHAASPGTRLLVEQLRDFPLADHDDGPDALEMALRLAAELLTGQPEDGLGARLVGP